jgi:hypothetical protein
MIVRSKSTVDIAVSGSGHESRIYQKGNPNRTKEIANMNIRTPIRSALTGLALAVVVVATGASSCDPPDNPGAPSAQMTVTGQKNQTGGTITITGSRFRPNAPFRAGYSGGPLSGVEYGQTGYADANGALTITDTVSCLNQASHQDGFGTVTVVVTDQDVAASVQPAPDQLAIGKISATYWVCV